MCKVVKLLPDKAIIAVVSMMGDRVSALRNAANHICRQAVVEGEHVPTYYTLCNLLKVGTKHKTMPTHIGQEAIKKLGKAWVSFFRLLRQHAAGDPSTSPACYSAARTGRRLPVPGTTSPSNPSWPIRCRAMCSLSGRAGRFALRPLCDTV